MKLTHLPFLVLMMLMFCFQSVTISDETTISDEEITQDDGIAGNSDLSLVTQLKSKYDKRIKFPLPYLLDKHYANQANNEEFAEYAKSMGYKSKGNKIEVAIEFSAEVEELITDNVIKRYEIEDNESGKKWLKCYMPVNKLERIIDEFPEITEIRQTYVAKHTAITTEGIALTNATDWHSAGNDGSGIKVAIIDSGFQYISNMVASGDFAPSYYSQSFSGEAFPGSYYHGTECAAIVYDFVPNAEFHLLMISDNGDFKQAKDYCIANGIDVVSMSLGWDGYWFGDGMGDVCDTAKEMANNGILVVNSAGNEAENYYWYGTGNNFDSNNYMEFASGDYSNNINPTSTGTLALCLTWDNSYTSDDDYDLYLCDSSGRILTGSENYQSIAYDPLNPQLGTQPVEVIYYRVNANKSYQVKVRKYNADGTSNFRLYCSMENSLEYASAAYSIVDPATASEIFTVGAIRQSTWNYTTVPIEYFSSNGPTSDGRIKPDICGPDGTLSTYYTTGFYGTSSSCPHVAGAAALYASSLTTAFNSAQVRGYLESNAIDCGTTGKDNVFGYGKLNLGTPGPIAVPDKVVLSSPANNAIDQPISVNLQWYEPAGAPTIYQLLYSNDGFVADSHQVDNITTESYTLSGLSYSATYSWQVRAYNSGGWGEWSDIWNFTTAQPTAPDKVVLSSPSNTATNQPLSLNLQWNEPSGSPLYYQLQYSPDGFTTVIEVNNIYGESYPLSGLAYNTTYSWQVRAYNSIGWGDWSERWTFTTIPPVIKPGDVELISPTDGATRQKSTIVFEWKAPTAGGTPTMYWLEIATDSGFTSVIYSNANITGRSIRVSGLPKATTLYWRVRAGNAGGWSDEFTAWIWHFTTK